MLLFRFLLLRSTASLASRTLCTGGINNKGRAPDMAEGNKAAMCHQNDKCHKRHRKIIYKWNSISNSLTPTRNQTSSTCHISQQKEVWHISPLPVNTVVKKFVSVSGYRYESSFKSNRTLTIADGEKGATSFHVVLDVAHLVRSLLLCFFCCWLFFFANYDVLWQSLESVFLTLRM